MCMQYITEQTLNREQILQVYFNIAEYCAVLLPYTTYAVQKIVCFKEDTISML